MGGGGGGGQEEEREIMLSVGVEVVSSCVLEKKEEATGLATRVEEVVKVHLTFSGNSFLPTRGCRKIRCDNRRIGAKRSRRCGDRCNAWRRRRERRRRQQMQRRATKMKYKVMMKIR